MTLTLILIRHAKSGWDDPFAQDHARVLNSRGRAAAPAIGAWLAAQGHLPELVLCSDAARTQETAALILPHLAPAPALQLVPALYHASPDTMLDQLRKQTARSVAMIGHNPGIAMFAAGMISQRPAHPRFGDYPTCATCVITFDIDHWGNAARHSGSCAAFITPADLPIFRA
ncbi:SixA phosphatase family protein [Yoonia vestfoldensis]|jgi:phosphohistidine phosphatase|uniref:Histidine phosphatase superfamily (Branch 1) n=1 Tax=Yoonia vestfoldensis TaxID=245188 RepID=A0A1Y0EFB6_9RHOB|nr:histidine phosphatase family protein [Yoonia vestfoldensis]ARU02336.1 histidine phosphatase superfamily (branch 1) [Yoonia vestfoldensis]